VDLSFETFPDFLEAWEHVIKEWLAGLLEVE
jgi:hypothetical protein